MIKQSETLWIHFQICIRGNRQWTSIGKKWKTDFNAYLLVFQLQESIALCHHKPTRTTKFSRHIFKFQDKSRLYIPHFLTCFSAFVSKFVKQTNTDAWCLYLHKHSVRLWQWMGQGEICNSVTDPQRLTTSSTLQALNGHENGTDKGMVWPDTSKPALICFSLQEYTQQNPLPKF
jgi:hypothetical protein